MSMFTSSLTRQFDEDNIVMWEPVKHLRIKLRPQMCGCKQTHGWSGVSSTAEWMNFIVKSWYFSALFFHVLFLEMLRKWFQLSHKTWSHFLFAQHLEAYVMLGLWWTCLRYDIFFLKNQSLKPIMITFCKKRLSCDRVIKRGLGNLSSQARW